MTESANSVKKKEPLEVTQKQKEKQKKLKLFTYNAEKDVALLKQVMVEESVSKSGSDANDSWENSWGSFKIV